MSIRKGCGYPTAIALCAILAAQPVYAQKTGSTIPAKPSFSNSESNSKSATAKTAPISDQDVADAIMGSALQDLYHVADEHYHKGEWNHTINLYKVIEQGDPHNMDTYSDAAHLLWSSDRNDQAIEQLKAGIAANPSTSYMYDELGMHYWIRMHDATSAIPYYEKAIQFPVGWTTYHSLAHCYEKLGQWDKAVSAWRQATKYGDDVRAPALLKQAEKHLADAGSHK